MTKTSKNERASKRESQPSEIHLADTFEKPA